MVVIRFASTRIFNLCLWWPHVYIQHRTFLFSYPLPAKMIARCMVVCTFRLVVGLEILVISGIYTLPHICFVFVPFTWHVFVLTLSYPLSHPLLQATRSVARSAQALLKARGMVSPSNADRFRPPTSKPVRAVSYVEAEVDAGELESPPISGSHRARALLAVGGVEERGGGEGGEERVGDGEEGLRGGGGRVEGRGGGEGKDNEKWDAFRKAAGVGKGDGWESKLDTRKSGEAKKDVTAGGSFAYVLRVPSLDVAAEEVAPPSPQVSKLVMASTEEEPGGEEDGGQGVVEEGVGGEGLGKGARKRGIGEGDSSEVHVVGGGPGGAGEGADKKGGWKIDPGDPLPPRACPRRLVSLLEEALYVESRKVASESDPAVSAGNGDARSGGNVGGDGGGGGGDNNSSNKTTAFNSKQQQQQQRKWPEAERAAAAAVAEALTDDGAAAAAERARSRAQGVAGRYGGAEEGPPPRSLPTWLAGAWGMGGGRGGVAGGRRGDGRVAESAVARKVVASKALGSGFEAVAAYRAHDTEMGMAGVVVVTVTKRAGRRKRSGGC